MSSIPLPPSTNKTSFSISLSSLGVLFFILLGTHNLIVDDSVYKLYGGQIAVVLSTIIFLSYGRARHSQIASFILSYCVLIIYTFITPLSVIEYWRFLFYLIPLFIIPWVFSLNTLIKVIFAAAFFLLISALFLYLMGIGASTGYGYTRLEGVMSEPSAVALPASLIFLYALKRKNALLLALSVVCGILSMSATVFFTAVTSLLIYTTMKARKSFTRAIIFLAGTSSFISLLYAYSFHFAESKIFILKRIQTESQFIFSLGEEGYSRRGQAFFKIFDYFKDEWNPVYGIGLGASDLLNEVELGIIPLFIDIPISFGILGLIVYVSAIALFFLNSRNDYANIIFSVFLVYTTINTASGIFFKIPLIMIIIAFLLNMQSMRFGEQKIRFKAKRFSIIKRNSLQKGLG